MPIKVECTGCGSTLRVPDEMLGRKVRCPKCQETFTAAEPESAPPPPPPRREEVRDDPPPRSKSRDYDDEEPASRSSRSRGKSYDDEDDRPSSRRRDDEDDRPSRRRDDDDDDRPSRRRAFADDDDDRGSRGGGGEKPSSVQTAGILMLIGGILACLSALYMGAIYASTLICCLYPSYIYSLVVGIMAIIRGSALLGDKAYKAGPSTGIAIMMIINIVNFDIFTMVLGIIALVMLNQDESKRYLGRG